MTRILLVIAVAGLGVALYASTAGGGQQAVTPGQFAALKKQVAALQKDVKTLKARSACLTAVGFADFGDGQTSGYHYKQPDGTEILTSALDLTSENETPAGFIAGIDSQCVSALRFARLHVHTTTSR
jgi:hypothetical protein